MVREQPSPQQLRAYLMQVGHALNLVCELPEWIERSPLPKHLRHAAAEAFAMNTRVLAEFLWSTASYRTDIRASDYCTTEWLQGERPSTIFVHGDKHVAHMTDERLRDPLVTLTYAERGSIRDQLLMTARAFAAAIDDPSRSALMSGYVDHASSLAIWPPPSTAGEDPASYIEAIQGLAHQSAPT